ncbi:hypothetical protein SPI_08971 [Niveomyces insectorum RCEF 264]|uniref:Uncharacterized protein n=1 Tax=Niveomyces insectorum RCEF 264 TaxID=1081102 RepID=A0A167MH76_9HYPO|nr:hypothetical protein SPI_08971 [Niveomyces insectorum RCEF 264]
MTAVQLSAATVQAHDDLAALFARNLTLNNPAAVSTPAPVAAPTFQPKITYSASQHYHHSAHLVRASGPSEQEQQKTIPAPLTAPPDMEHPAVEQLLAQNGIDRAKMTSVQFALFKMAPPDRRDHLLHVWRICPPNGPHGGETDPDPVTAAAVAAAAAGAWGANNCFDVESEMAKEMAAAHRRMQKHLQDDEQRNRQHEAMSLDGTTVVSTAPGACPPPREYQAADGCWVQAGANGYMEPYMLSGYEALARREYLASVVPPTADGQTRIKEVANLGYSQATDPVYANRLDSSGRASWPQIHSETEAMENQYGALIALRASYEMDL